MRLKQSSGILFALLAAALYALNAPFSKLLLSSIPPTLLAGFLYLGAGVGMVVVSLSRRLMRSEHTEENFSKRDLPYVLAMIVLDIAAPVALLFGLSYTTAANATLLNNFEIVATALIALLVFREAVGLRLWCGIFFITGACILLSFDSMEAMQFSAGSLLVLLACLFWGIENNCTRHLSEKDPLMIVLLKGIFSGIGSLIIGFFVGERVGNWWSVLLSLGLGFVAYGLSIFFYVYAQRRLGAARTSAYYAIAPFIGTLLSLLIFRNAPPTTYYISLGFMIVGAWLSSGDGPLFLKKRS